MGGIGTKGRGYITTKITIGIITVPMSYGVTSTTNGLPWDASSDAWKDSQ
jgi:hypothetical protein